MEGLKGSAFITIKEIQILKGCSFKQAHRDHQAIRDALGITGSLLPVLAYIEYLGVDPKHIIPFLNSYR